LEIDNDTHEELTVIFTVTLSDWEDGTVACGVTTNGCTNGFNYFLEGDKQADTAAGAGYSNDYVGIYVSTGGNLRYETEAVDWEIFPAGSVERGTPFTFALRHSQSEDSTTFYLNGVKSSQSDRYSKNNHLGFGGAGVVNRPTASFSLECVSVFDTPVSDSGVSAAVGCPAAGDLAGDLAVPGTNTGTSIPVRTVFLAHTSGLGPQDANTCTSGGQVTEMSVVPFY
jgi:hypothetical protein